MFGPAFIDVKESSKESNDGQGTDGVEHDLDASHDRLLLQ